MNWALQTFFQWCIPSQTTKKKLSDVPGKVVMFVGADEMIWCKRVRTGDSYHSFIALIWMCAQWERKVVCCDMLHNILPLTVSVCLFCYQCTHWLKAFCEWIHDAGYYKEAAFWEHHVYRPAKLNSGFFCFFRFFSTDLLLVLKHAVDSGVSHPVHCGCEPVDTGANWWTAGCGVWGPGWPQRQAPTSGQRVHSCGHAQPVELTGTCHL